MKRLNIVLLAVALMCTASITMAQTSEKELKKIERAKKKKAREQQYSQNKEEFLELLNNKNFTIKATTLQSRNSFTYNVTPITNFIKVEGDEVTVQTAGGMHPGYNGLGGLTINGRITKYEVAEESDSHSINATIMFNSAVLGHSTMYLSIQPTGNTTARISDNWGGRITYRGTFEDLNESRVYEGMTII